MTNLDLGVALGWDDEVKGTEFVQIPTGEYQFKVEKFEKSYFDGSPKMSACPCADVTFAIEYEGNVAHIERRLFLHSKWAWLLASFFSSIGCPKNENGQVKMDWSRVMGATGRCKVVLENYTTKDGRVGIRNKIDGFITTEQAPSNQTQQQAQQFNSYNPTPNTNPGGWNGNGRSGF